MPIRHDTTVPRSSLWDNDHVGDLDDLDDVTITTPAEGESLIYSSGVWVNSSTSNAGLISGILMEEGITDPPEPVWEEDGTDYVYTVD